MRRRLALGCAAVLAGPCGAQLFALYDSVLEFTSTDAFEWEVISDDATVSCLPRGEARAARRARSAQAWVVSFYSLSACSKTELKRGKTAAERCRDTAEEFAESAWAAPSLR